MAILEDGYSRLSELSRSWRDQVAEALASKEVAEELLGSAEKKAEGHRTEVERLTKELTEEKERSMALEAKVHKTKKAISRAKNESKEQLDRLQACEALHQDALVSAQKANELAREAANRADAAEEKAKLAEARANEIEAEAAAKIGEAERRASQAEKRAVEAENRAAGAEARIENAIGAYKLTEDFKDEVLEASTVSYEVGFEDCRQAVTAIYPDLDMSRVVAPIGGESQGEDDAEDAEDAGKVGESGTVE